MKKALKRKGIYIVTIIFVLQAIITVFSLVSGEESIVISDAVLDAVRMQDRKLRKKHFKLEPVG